MLEQRPAFPQSPFKVLLINETKFPNEFSAVALNESAFSLFRNLHVQDLHERTDLDLSDPHDAAFAFHDATFGCLSISAPCPLGAMMLAAVSAALRWASRYRWLYR